MRRSRPPHRPEMRRATNSHIKPSSEIERADPLMNDNVMEAMLSQRHPLPPEVDMTDTDLTGTFLDRIPPVMSGPLGLGMGPMTTEEERKLKLDVYGLRGSEYAREEERLQDLEREIGRLGRDERSALEKALRRYPLLTIASPHVRFLLGEEDFDAPSAARRLARYWRQREAVFGSNAFAKGLFANPTFDQYLKHYHRCTSAMDDSELDEEMRKMARDYVQIVNRVKIDAMDKLIEVAPVKDRSALMEARRLNPELASSDRHKLLFLKAEDFVETRAATRMMKYWDMKKTLFGSDRLGEKITLADVDSSIFYSNAEGHSLLVSDTDERGRSVFWVSSKELSEDGWTPEGVAQYMWYILHIALSHSSCRNNGLVVMVNCHGMGVIDRTSANRALCMPLLHYCMPFQVRAIHCFFAPSTWWQNFMLGVLKKVSPFVNKRMVMHLGSFEENIRVLDEDFGIGPDQILTELGGNVDIDWWKDWVRKRKEEGL